MLEPGLQDPAEQPISDETIHASLTVIAPASLSGLRLDLRTGHWLVGRSGTIRFDTPGVSRQHAWIDTDSTGTSITDAGSKNGTTVNSRSITARTFLSHGDIVTFGDVRVRYSSMAEDEATVDWSPEVFDHSNKAYQGETTRYLCAAVHIDEKFCTHVVNEVVRQPYRAVCPSYGVDLVAVAKHALSALRRRLLRDSVLTGLLIFWAVVLLIAFPNDPSTDDWSWFPWGISVAVALAAWLVVGAELFWQRYIMLAQRLSRSAPQPLDIPPPFSRQLRARLESIARVQKGNVLTFSGYEPFIGSGARLSHWAFAIDVGRGAVDSETGTGKVPMPFAAGDLYDALTSSIAALGVPGLRIDERLFVNGRDVWRFHELLPSRQKPPTGQASPKLLRKLLKLNRGSARTYLCFEVTGWHGQLVITMFVRAVRIKESLYLEWTSTALLPLRSRYSVVDTVSHRAFDAAAWTIGRGFAAAFPSLLLSPMRLCRGMYSRYKSYTQRSQQRRLIMDSRNFDYGARTSIREEATGSTFNRYFLELDTDMYVKVVQERLLQAIRAFLNDHDIDTSGFTQQQVSINNSQTYNLHGDVGPGAAFGKFARGGNVQQAASSVKGPQPQR